MVEPGPRVAKSDGAGPELVARRVAPPRAPQGRLARWGRRLALAAILAALAPALVIAIYRVVPPPLTPLMVIRNVEGEPIRQHWVPYHAISPALVGAVMASEDENFCGHSGFDLGAMREAWQTYRATGRLRGASTISQQTAKNLFLWPVHSFVRKAVEAYITVLLELMWPKQRILEVYLNVIEWGPGLYGADSAAQAYFGHPAVALSAHQAALLAAVLPNPRAWSPVRPPPRVERRAEWILARMGMFTRGCG